VGIGYERNRAVAARFDGARDTARSSKRKNLWRLSSGGYFLHARWNGTFRIDRYRNRVSSGPSIPRPGGIFVKRPGDVMLRGRPGRQQDELGSFPTQGGLVRGSSPSPEWPLASDGSGGRPRVGEATSNEAEVVTETRESHD